MLQGICAFATALTLAATPTRPFVDGECSPTGRLMVARPSLSWSISAEKVSSISATINGVPVPGMFDPRACTVLASARDPLSPGTHEAEFVLELADGRRVRKAWSFEVLPGAHAELPAPLPEAARAIGALNELRRRAGLMPLRTDPQLSAAAQAHSAYLRLNNASGHAQLPSLPGFCGESPAERLRAFDFTSAAFECVDFGGITPEEGVSNLWNAPYHRLPLMQRGTSAVGAGYDGRRTTIEVGVSAAEGIVVSPGAGETNVPTTWEYVERPNPLRLHGFPRSVGHVIVLADFGSGSNLILHEASLDTVEGQPVPIWVNSPSNDEHLSNAVFLIPQRPLHPMRTYRVRVRASRDGKPMLRDWAFTTAAS
ncbi:MAG TPA: CAP domain-containing protein [Fimbriimonadaceae bacterium]|nr:CAP domain-containing protein [Fimbriimonadaceae bacterium]